MLAARLRAPAAPPSAAAGCHPVDVQSCGFSGGMIRRCEPDCGDPPIGKWQVTVCELCATDTDCRADGQCIDIGVMRLPEECGNYRQCVYPGDACHGKHQGGGEWCTATTTGGKPHHWGIKTAPP